MRATRLPTDFQLPSANSSVRCAARSTLRWSRTFSRSASLLVFSTSTKMARRGSAGVAAARSAGDERLFGAAGRFVAVAFNLGAVVRFFLVAGFWANGFFAI